MLSSLASVLKLASFVLCMIVVVSFVLFAVNRTSSASQHQQRELNGETSKPNGEGEAGVAPDTGGGKSSARRTIDEISEAITSPFAGLTDGSSSQWLARTIDLLLALVVYGVGLGFVARSIRIRA
ncbi:MAG TPA: hypothetical protein VK707_08975 [Solirubrobacteraceae bacterium]|nr:hypothetical protein [Solirubrobacteraceae bacterium]